MEKPRKDLEKLFLRIKPTRTLINLKKAAETRYASILAKEVDCTYAHMVKLLQKLEEMGLVEFTRKGRIKFVELTDIGKDIADELEILIYRRLARIEPIKEAAKEIAKEAEKPEEKEKKESKEETPKPEKPVKKK